MIITDSTAGPKSGKYVEQIGSYDAVRKTRSIDVDRAKYWMSQGAILSDTVHNIFISESLKEGKKRNVLPKKAPIVSEKIQEPAPVVEEKIETPKEDAPTKTEEVKAEAPKEDTAPDAEEKDETPKEKEQDPENGG